MFGVLVFLSEWGVASRHVFLLIPTSPCCFAAHIILDPATPLRCKVMGPGTVYEPLINSTA